MDNIEQTPDDGIEKKIDNDLKMTDDWEYILNNQIKNNLNLNFRLLHEAIKSKWDETIPLSWEYKSTLNGTEITLDFDRWYNVFWENFPSFELTYWDDVYIFYYSSRTPKMKILKNWEKFINNNDDLIRFKSFIIKIRKEMRLSAGFTASKTEYNNLKKEINS